MQLIFSLHNYVCGVSFAGITNADTHTLTLAHTHTLKDKEFCTMRATAATNGMDMVSSP